MAEDEREREGVVDVGPDVGVEDERNGHSQRVGNTRLEGRVGRRTSEEAGMSFRDFNQQIVDEFRANDGKVGGGFAGAPMVILHTKGRKTGKARENPVVYQQVGDDIAVFGSKGGAPTHPDWFLNLVASSEAIVEVGTERYSVKARVAEGEERERIWTKQKELMPGFADYENRTTREIPVVILERS
jgi:deazaflavin-dependent oxidoreductase (nitroreductase family)